MSISLHFIGWQRPVAESVRGFLLPAVPPGPVDLQSLLVVVPTRQAGRRLREGLALACSEAGTGLLSPRVATPTSLLLLEDDGPLEASEALVGATWAAVLQRIDTAHFQGLLPTRVAVQDFAWALQTGEMIQGLRAALADGGHTLASVQAGGFAAEEADRWANLAELERLYLAKLAEAGRRDPLLRRLAAAESAAAAGVARIVVAGVPDPSLLALRALRTLAATRPVDILVHAPPDMAHTFDEWGRPRPEFWGTCLIDCPAPDRNILLAGSPADQSRLALEIMAQEADDFGPGDMAVGVADRDVIPHLEADLAELDMPAFDPADRLVRDHALFRLVDQYVDLVADPTSASARAILRNADVLTHLERRLGVSPAALLCGLDAVHNLVLPRSLDDLAEATARVAVGRERCAAEARAAMPAITWLREAARAAEPSAIEALQRFLRDVYAERELYPGRAVDDEFRQAARCINGGLLDFTEPGLGRMLDGPKQFLALARRTLARQTYPRERDNARIDLEGWLELAWNNASVLIVTGMNEGFVPDGRIGDAFIPDTLRTRLGLRDDAGRMARDAFLMRTCIETRRAEGRIGFICGKRSRAGDPLLPSRLLFRCPDQELPARARRLFGTVRENRASVPASISFRLDAWSPAALHGAPGAPRSLRVTAFRDYLACPFRFYLKHVLGMSSMDDEKEGPDAMDFGNMVHAALEAMAADATLRRADDPEILSAFLADHARAWCARRFAAPADLPLRVAMEAAAQRLRAAAFVQAALTREGWEIVAHERRFEFPLGGLTVTGTIDRIDRHCDTGAVRIIDYKTSDRADAPEEAHLRAFRDDDEPYTAAPGAGKQRRWSNLQLPLYDLLLAAEFPRAEHRSVAYFNLPKAVTETGLVSWRDYGEEQRSAARRCATEVAQRIRNGVFWPPAERVDNDEFAHLFPAPVVECVKEPA